MDKKELIAPCGLDCFNCPVQEENITEQTRLGMAKHLNLPPEEIACKGCKPENGRCRFHQDCATWECAQKKGVSYCFECDDFPCGLLAPSAKGAQYPHNMKVYNLCRMKLIGLDEWIKESASIRKRYYEGDFVVGKGPIVKED